MRLPLFIIININIIIMMMILIIVTIIIIIITIHVHMLGKGQMGSALMGSLRISCFLTGTFWVLPLYNIYIYIYIYIHINIYIHTLLLLLSYINYLFMYISVDPICPQPRCAAPCATAHSSAGRPHYTTILYYNTI